MIDGLLAGLFWGIDTVILGIAIKMAPFINDELILIAPFLSSFIHDLFSSFYSFIYNLLKGNLKKNIFKNKNFKYIVLASIIGGPIGMSGYVLTIKYMGASIGAVASAIYPAIGALLAYFFLKEKLSIKRWIFLIITIIGIYGLSFSKEINIINFKIGLLGVLMCSVGWGMEAVIINKYVKDNEINHQTALLIRQLTSSIVYMLIIVPMIKINNIEFIINKDVLLIISISALFGTLSYLLFYKAIIKIGSSRAMALDSTYSAFAFIISIIFLKEYELINPLTIICALVVIVFAILAGNDFNKN